ncbi:MAG: GNAT family N-acetyltransferase [Shimia sp.]|nr:GNAT family N-acetyltransferase [Shimia sp.]
MTEMVIRPARAADLAPLQALAREVIEVRYTPFLGEAMVADYVGSGAADAEVAKHPQHMTVAEKDGHLVGFVVCFDDLAHLLMTRVDQQRSGIGTALIASCFTQIAARGHKVARVETFTDNTQARRFYRKTGWRESGFGTVDGTDIALVFFEKTI